MVRSWILALAFIGAVPAQAASAVTVDLSPTADAPIKQFMIDTNFRDAALSTRSSANNEQRTVMQFDLSSIPAGVTITAATLRLYGHAILGSTDVTNIFLFQVPRVWLENEVTYRQARNFNDWANLGGDFVGITGAQNSLPFATWTGPQSGATDAWYSVEAQPLVHRWHAGLDANNGLLLRGSTGNELEFASSEDPIVANRPYLQITYVVPEPASAVLLALAVIRLFDMKRNVVR
jgi:hypothetical protein